MQLEHKSKSLWIEAFSRLSKNKSAIVSLFYIIAITIIAIFADQLAPYSYSYQDHLAILSPPSFKHWLGTDNLGRDLLSRIIYGARVSLSVAFFSTIFSLILGTAYGAVSGYLGGKIDNLLMRFADIIYSFPDLLLIILINTSINRSSLQKFVAIFHIEFFNKVLTPEILSLLIALSLVSWVYVARLIRGEVLRIKEEKFVESARALGASSFATLTRHILPNTLGPLLVTLSFRIPAVILSESTLSFIGLGIQPPNSSWGTLANAGFAYLRFYPHLIIFPSCAIFFTVLAFNFLGDGLRDALSPSKRNY